MSNQMGSKMDIYRNVENLRSVGQFPQKVA